MCIWVCSSYGSWNEYSAEPYFIANSWHARTKMALSRGYSVKQKSAALKGDWRGPLASILESASMCRRSSDKEHLLVSQSSGGGWNTVGWWGAELLSEGESWMQGLFSVMRIHFSDWCLEGTTSALVSVSLDLVIHFLAGEKWRAVPWFFKRCRACWQRIMSQSSWG